MSLNRLARLAPRPHAKTALLKRLSATQYRHLSESSTRCPPHTTPSRSSQLHGHPRRRYASAATETVQPHLPDGLPPAISEAQSTPLVPVLGTERISPLLQDLKVLLENEIGGDDLWSKRVAAALEDLQVTRKGRIAVIGDSLAAPQDVVSALLQDPLADTDASRRALLNRHKDANIDVFQISSGVELQRDPEALTLSSPWLQATGYDIVEVNTQDADGAISTTLRTDSLVIVLDPIRLLDAPRLSTILPSALSRGSVHFVINGNLPPNTSETSIESRLREQLTRVKVETAEDSAVKPSLPGIYFVRADAALQALDALAAGLQDHGSATSTSKTRAFEVFQNQFLASHIGPLQASLLNTLKLQTQPQLATAHDTAVLALAHIDGILAADRDIVRNASHTVAELRRTAQQGATKAKHLSVASRGIEGGLVEGGVQHEMEKIKGGLEQRFEGRLSWLGLVGRARVDDVAPELGTYIGTQFGIDLERQVIFETGQLSHLQTSLTSSSDQTIRQLSHPSHSPTSTHPFTSPLLLNHLSTLSLSIPPLSSTSLLTPILTRREQLLTQSVPRLHTSAQRALLTTYSTSLLGMSLSWMTYVPPFALTSASTAAGLGILSVVASLAFGQKLWSKAQKKFWKDWHRITGMLKGDLETRFNTALQTQVIAKPLAAAEGLEKLIEKRQHRLDTLQDKVNQLSSRL